MIFPVSSPLLPLPKSQVDLPKADAGNWPLQEKASEKASEVIRKQ